ncbi:hypothetical protein SPI_03909 [Niveomyces insectorum RCEF 264]|uniref:DUF7707 domain-containing protein n=1 Tax=Niveomyces insectorum RCEF 264 TaxID=1081102 RepID=A0A167WG29_9HYPO|nr:hypothetical protein SPI_03909 [Niveomyces insectorum RCEF 264]
MLSLKFTLLAAAAALVSVVRADYHIDPSSVPLYLRDSWCQSEISSCPLICDQTPPFNTLTNTCDAASLTYGCVCGNGLQPNVSEYSLTLPYFICQEWGNQCVAACGMDSSCSSDCRQNHPCGALNPVRANSTSASAGSTATASDSAAASNQIFTGLGDNPSTATGTAKKSLAVPQFESGRVLMGVAMVLSGLAAGCALVL